MEELLRLLAGGRIEVLVDVRRFPGSRRLPHFGRAPLEGALAAAGIGYRWMPELGGRRRARPDSRNVGWRHAAFRGYADYMETPPFAAALEALIGVAATQRTAIMCAEALWWQCHRRLISDALVARGHPVHHIRAPGVVESHTLQPPARLVNGELRYDAASEAPAGQRKLDLSPSGDDGA